jgi:hypothetical protein
MPAVDKAGTPPFDQSAGDTRFVGPTASGGPGPLVAPPGAGQAGRVRHHPDRAMDRRRPPLTDCTADRPRQALHFSIGVYIFDFQDDNTFTMRIPESAKATGVLTFRRSGTPR